MALFQPVSFERHQEELSDFLYLGRQKITRMRQEWDVCRDIYQGIATKPAGGVDTSLVTAVLQSQAANVTEDVPIDSLKLITMTLFLQSKLTLSEPSVVTKAYNSDDSAHKAARFAQLAVEHIKAATPLKTVVEKDFNLNAAQLGMAILYAGWNPDGGRRVLDAPENFDPMVDEFTMEGDYEFRSVSPYNFIIDPAATSFHVDATHCAELRRIPLKPIIYAMQKRYRHDAEKLEKIITFLENFSKECQTREFAGKNPNASSQMTERGQFVLLWEYWERAEPWNGLLGRYSLFADVDMNEQARLLHTESHPFKHRQLPFSVLTDLDVSEDPYGMSRSMLALPACDAISQFYTQVLANIEIHGSVRVLMPEGAVSNESLSDAPYKPIFFNAALGEKPTYLNPSAVTSDIWRLHTLLEKEIDALYGANEFSRGEIPRELSSYAVSQAVERDDQFRIRLFNKKKEVYKRVFEQALSLTQQYVTEKRAFLIAGDTNSYQIEYFAGADLEGHYGVFVDYGLYQPADPHARKQQILEIYKSGLYREAGGNMQKLISTLVDGDMIDVRDMFEGAKLIQEHEIARMINGEEAPVQPWHEHNAHYECIVDFMQKIQMERLDPEIQKRIFEHSEIHKQEIAKLKAAAAQSAPQPGAPGATVPEQLAATQQPPAEQPLAQ